MLISVGIFINKQDSRFEAFQGPSENQWTLQIKNVQDEDAGTYQCKILGSSSTWHEVTLIMAEGNICCLYSSSLNF